MEKEIINKKDIVRIAIEAVHNRVAEFLGSQYNSPLNAYITEAVNEKGADIKALVVSCLDETIGTKEFKKLVKEEFSHKVAKAMVSKLEGTVEKAVEVLRQDQTLRARMILAIENIIKENE